MTNRFMISVAAVALIAGTGFANAQGTGMGKEPSTGSTVQQNAPSSGPSTGSSAGKMGHEIHLVRHEVQPVGAEVADGREE